MSETYRHTPDMGEISGFGGGGYEKVCQDMLEAGVTWLHEHPKAELEGTTIKNVYGIFTPESDDAKELDAVILKASDNEATGAMHHAVMSRLFYIAKNGWNAYCTELRRRERYVD